MSVRLPIRASTWLLAACLTPPLVLAQPAAAIKPGDAQAAKPYDEQANARDQIAAALARAKRDNRRVLLQWGGNWCHWCVLLHNLFRSDQEIARKLMYEYEVVYVDAGREQKNMDLAEQYGARAKQDGFPYLTVLDAGGNAIANQETSTFENQDQQAQPGHDRKLVLAFLTKHQAPYLEAAKLLAAGLAAAQQSGKSVFLHFGAPWCSWCHRLEEWLASAEVGAILGKQFVDVKIDTDRTVGGKELLEKLAHGKSSGIPWFVMLDSNGAPVIDSNLADGQNIGFPTAPQEIEHFATMLKQAATRLTAADIDRLKASLQKK